MYCQMLEKQERMYWNIYMSIFWHVDNIELLMLAALISSQNASNEVKLLQKKLTLVGPGLLQWYVA